MATLLITKKIKEYTDILQGFENENYINTKKKKKKRRKVVKHKTDRSRMTKFSRETL